MELNRLIKITPDETINIWRTEVMVETSGEIFSTILTIGKKSMKEITSPVIAIITDNLITIQSNL